MSNNVIYLHGIVTTNQPKTVGQQTEANYYFFCQFFFPVIVCIFSVYLMASPIVATNDDECVKIILV